MPSFYSKKTPRRITKRKINPEFTTAIRAAKMIRVCAANMPPDRSRFHRLAKFILHHVIQADILHQPGERQLLRQHLKVFEGYEFDPAVPVSTYLKGDITLSKNDIISVTIPFPEIIYPEHACFCKIILLGVGADLQTFTTTTMHTAATSWIALNDEPRQPVYLEICNDHPLFIALGIAYANNEAVSTICQSVKIIAVNR